MVATTSRIQPVAITGGTGSMDRVAAGKPPPAQAMAPSATEAVTEDREIAADGAVVRHLGQSARACGDRRDEAVEDRLCLGPRRGDPGAVERAVDGQQDQAADDRDHRHEQRRRSRRARS